jgi:hypothetical protein
MFSTIRPPKVGEGNSTQGIPIHRFHRFTQKTQKVATSDSRRRRDLLHPDFEKDSRRSRRSENESV